MTACPKAWARWLLPIPGGPSKSTSRASRMKRPVARSNTSLRLIDGLNCKSKSSNVLGSRNRVTQTFDDNDRLVRCDVEVGEGVSDDTTFEVYKYDGLSRLTWAEDDDTLVTRQYDSLSHVTRDP